MSARRWLVGAALAGILLTSMGIGVIVPPALAAGIADPLDVNDIRHLDFVAPLNAGAYRTTVPASVLKDAIKQRASGPAGGYTAITPEMSAKNSAQLAAAHRQTAAGAALSAANGPSVKDWTAAQKTATKPAAAMASIKSKFTLPATAQANIGKAANVVGGASFVMLGAQVGFGVGKGVSNAMGFDAVSGLCNPTFNDGGWIAIVTGTDCSQFFNIAADYPTNEDAASSVLGQKVCNARLCIQLVADVPKTYTNGTSAGAQRGYCFIASDPATGAVVTSITNGSANYGGGANYVKMQHATQQPKESVFSKNDTLTPVVGNGSSASCNRAGVAATNWSYDIAGTLNPLVSYGFGTSSAGTTFAQSTPVEQLAANPSRTLTCTIVATDGTSYTAESPAFTEDGGILPAPTCPAVPDGLTAETVTVTESPGKPGDPAIQLYEETTTDAYQQLSTTFPECVTGLCYADLRKLNPGTGTGTQSCFDLADTACVDWFVDPNKAAQYVCEYGGSVVDLAECNHYANVFDASKRAAGQAYADAETGTGTKTGTVPPTGSGTPSVGGAAGQVGSDKPPVCYPTGWGVLNPVEWVVRPVGCALQEAFVPRASVVEAQLGAVGTAWSATPPGVLVGYFEEIQAELPNLEGCEGPGLNLSIDFRPAISWAHLDYNGYPMSACEAPWSGLATATRVLFATTVLYGAFRAITAYIGGIVGFKGFGKAV